MDDDVHTQLYLANLALQTIADLAAAEELDLNVTNGWRLGLSVAFDYGATFGGLGAVGPSRRVGLVPCHKVGW